MLLFAAAARGNIGRTVTLCNVALRCAQRGSNVAYLDWDPDEPSAARIYGVDAREAGAYDVWKTSEHDALRAGPAGAGSLVLRVGQEPPAGLPDLFARLDQEFDLVLVEPAAGRSKGLEQALSATASVRVACRWLVFHRWTLEHVRAAADMVYGRKGIIEAGTMYGHDREWLRNSLRFVRTAVADPAADDLEGLRAAQVAWLDAMDRELRRVAGMHGAGTSMTLDSVPFEPVLQWREQLITDADASTRGVANEATIEAYDRLASSLTGEWAVL